MCSQKWNCAASLVPKQNYNVLSPNSFTHISVRDLYISRIGWYFAAAKYVDRSWEYQNLSQTHECGNGIEAAQFPEKEYINGIFVVVQWKPGGGGEMVGATAAYLGGGGGNRQISERAWVYRFEMCDFKCQGRLYQ